MWIVTGQLLPTDGKLLRVSILPHPHPPQHSNPLLGNIYREKNISPRFKKQTKSTKKKPLDFLWLSPSCFVRQKFTCCIPACGHRLLWGIGSLVLRVGSSWLGSAALSHVAAVVSAPSVGHDGSGGSMLTEAQIILRVVTTCGSFFR